MILFFHVSKLESETAIIMSLRSLEKAFDLIEKNSGDFEGRKSDALIVRTENFLNLQFPPSYRKFLSELGCGDIEGLEFYGLIGDEFESSSVPDAIWLTAEERKRGLPKEFIVIFSAGEGTYYAIDTSVVNSDGESPIMSYGVNSESEKISDDFGSFLLMKLQTVLGKLINPN